MHKKTYFYITSTIFLIVGIVHLLKLVVGFQIEIFGMPYPIWLSVIEMSIAFVLAYVGFRQCK